MITSSPIAAARIALSGSVLAQQQPAVSPEVLPELVEGLERQQLQIQIMKGFQVIYRRVALEQLCEPDNWLDDLEAFIFGEAAEPAVRLNAHDEAQELV